MRRQLPIVLSAALLVAMIGCGGDVAEPGEQDEPARSAAAHLGLEQEGVVRVGSDVTYPPFEFIEDGQLKGFDVELMDEIARRLAVQADWVEAEFDTLLTRLTAGDFDVVISALPLTDDRPDGVTFSDPYFEAVYGLAVPVGSDIGGMDDLAGKSVGAQTGTAGEAYAAEQLTGSDIVGFPSHSEAFTALEGGQVDALVWDLPSVAEQEEHTDLAVLDVLETEDTYGIAVQSGNAALLEAINTSLAEIIDDSAYAEIYARWFEGDVPSRFVH